MNSGATYDNIGDPQYRATHCDVVVEAQPGRIRVIGGNVSQTVGEKWLRTLPDGRLSLVGAQSTFFAVIRCGSGALRRRPGAGARRPPCRDESARVLRVMELLVDRYGYPVNGAAGLVGNLIAESGVLPNRIEGSQRGDADAGARLRRPRARLDAGRGPRPELQPAHRARGIPASGSRSGPARTAGAGCSGTSSADGSWARRSCPTSTRRWTTSSPSCAARIARSTPR